MIAALVKRECAVYTRALYMRVLLQAAFSATRGGVTQPASDKARFATYVDVLASHDAQHRSFMDLCSKKRIAEGK